MPDSFEFEVVMPEKAKSSFSVKKRLPRIEVSSNGQDESWIVPVRVAKLIDKQVKSGEFCPASRAELAYKIRELSQTLGSTRLAELVNKRDYSVKEAMDKLISDGYSPDVARKIVMRAKECGLIDDARFAASYIRFKLSCGWGPKKIAFELSKKGIDIAEVEGWPDAFLEDESEEDRALRLASKRRLTGKNDYQKIVRYLSSKGFSFCASAAAARQILNENLTSD